MLDIDAIKKKLAELQTEHRDLDEIIERMGKDPTVSPLQMQRLKKRKLAIKDQIAKLQSNLLPDIIA